MITPLTKDSPRPVGFSAILIIDALYTELVELQRLVAALEQAGYRIRLRMVPNEVDPDGVIGARLILAREVVPAPASSEPEAPAKTRGRLTPGKGSAARSAVEQRIHQRRKGKK